MSARNSTDSKDQPSTARRAVLTGGAVGLAAVAGSALGRVQPADAQTGVQPTPDWINVTDLAYGAVGDGSTNDTAAIRSAIAAVPASGGVVYFPAGNYVIQSTITIEIGGPYPGTGQGPIYLVGDGRDVSVLSFNGTGACIHMYNPTSPGVGFTTIQTWGGGVLGLTIDGSGTVTPGNVAYGLHIGDGEEYQLDLKVQNFSVAGSIGIYIYNTVWWVGRMHAKAQVLNCDSAVVFDVASGAGGGNNFGYSDWEFDIFANVGQNGVTIQGGAQPYVSRLAIKGEFELGSGTGGTALIIDGPASPTAGNASSLTRCELDLWVETNNSLSGSGTMPQTMSFGNQYNKIKTCHGYLIFNGNSTNNWVPVGTANFTPGQEQFGFYGAVIGDTVLAPDSNTGNTSPLQLVGAPVLYAPGYLDNTGNMYIGNGDFFQVTLNSNTTISWSGNVSQAGPQRKTIILSQPTSGSNTNQVTWPGVVVWQGPAPVMPMGAGAIAIYQLETYDGSTWYGSTLYNSNASVPASFTPSNPTGTSNTGSKVMMGLGAACAFTATKSGYVLVNVTGYAVTPASVKANVGCRYAKTSVTPVPANGAAVTGTTLSVDTAVVGPGTSTGACFAFTAVVSLTQGSSYWFDLALSSGTASNTVSVVNVSMSMVEVAV